MQFQQIIKQLQMKKHKRTTYPTPPPIGAEEIKGHDYSPQALRYMQASQQLQQADSQRDLTEEYQTLAEFNAPLERILPISKFIPRTRALNRQSKVPFAFIVKPYSQQPFDTISYGHQNPIRCQECKGYLSPFCSVHARQWLCAMCNVWNTFPSFFMLPQNLKLKQELGRGSVEYFANQGFMDRPPMRPIYVFVLDTSPHAIRSGFLEVAIRAISDSIRNEELPGWQLALFALITYNDSIQLYNLRPTLHTPHVYVLSDVNDLFLPALKDDLLVPIQQSKQLILSLLAGLTASFSLQNRASCAFVGALKIAKMLMNHNGGRIILFQISRDLNIDEIDEAARIQQEESKTKEKQAAVPIQVNGQFASKSEVITRLAFDCNTVQIQVNLFIQGDSYRNLNALAALTKFTSGQLYFYEGAIDTQRLYFDIQKELKRKIILEAVMRARVSKGFRITSMEGNYSIAQGTADLISLPALDQNFTLAMHVEEAPRDKKAQGVQDVATDIQKSFHIQIVLLFTTLDGERKIQLHHCALPFAFRPAQIIEGINIFGLETYIIKLASLRTGMVNSLLGGKNSAFVTTREIIQAWLAITRQKGRGSRLPSSLQFLTQFTLGFLRGDLFAKTPLPKTLHIDVLNYLRFLIRGASAYDCSLLFGPTLYSLEAFFQPDFTFFDSENQPQLPERLSLTMGEIERVSGEQHCSAFLLDRGTVLSLYFQDLGESSLMKWFGQEVEKKILKEGQLPDQEEIMSYFQHSKLVQNLYNFVYYLRSNRQLSAKLELIYGGMMPRKSEENLKRFYSFKRHLIIDSLGFPSSKDAGVDKYRETIQTVAALQDFEHTLM